MIRYRVVFYRLRRDAMGQPYTSPKTITVDAIDPGHAERCARARLPWCDHEVKDGSGKVVCRAARAKIFDA